MTWSKEFVCSFSHENVGFITRGTHEIVHGGDLFESSLIPAENYRTVFICYL